MDDEGLLKTAPRGGLGASDEETQSFERKHVEIQHCDEETEQRDHEAGDVVRDGRRGGRGGLR